MNKPTFCSTYNTFNVYIVPGVEIIYVFGYMKHKELWLFFLSVCNELYIAIVRLIYCSTTKKANLFLVGKLQDKI